MELKLEGKKVAEKIAEIDILGTQYVVERRTYDEDELFQKKEIDGYCDVSATRIVICDKKTIPDNEFKNTVRIEAHALRHEIVHAFLYESGMDASTHRNKDEGWAVDEEIIDWIAVQAPKMFEVFEALDLLNY